MVAKYEMNHRLALDDIAHDLNTFGAPQGTELERIWIIMTALIEIIATQNSCTTGASRRTWGVKVHPGYDPKLDETLSTLILI